MATQPGQVVITKASFSPKKYCGNPAFAGYASIVLNDTVQIRDITVLNGDHGLAVELPSRPYRELCAECNRPSAAGYQFCPRCGKRKPEARLLPVEAGNGHVPIVRLLNTADHAVIESTILREVQKYGLPY